MTPVYVLPPGPHPAMPNVRDLAADRDWWRTLATRLLWDAARRSTLEAVCVRYGVQATATAPFPTGPGVRTIPPRIGPQKPAHDAEYAI